jgi:cbb3-type cytochrome oxidase subunit 3
METLVLCVVVYGGIAALIYMYRADKQKRKEEYEQKLLLQNPDAWERVKRMEMEKAEKNKDRAAGAAKTGIGLALRL